MYTIKINGEAYDQVPMELRDISLRRFLALRKFDVRNPLDLVYWAIDSKPRLTQEKNTQNEIAGLLSLIDPILSDIWEFMGSKEQQKVPDEIKVFGVKFETKEGLLNNLPYWGYVQAKNIYIEAQQKAIESKEDVDLTDKYPEILAHYLYADIVGKPYDEIKADKFQEVILDLPFTDCIQLGNFFLRKLKKTLKSMR